MIMIPSINDAWVSQLAKTLKTGDEVSPRGIETLELRNQIFTVDMNYPALTVKARKLSYRFMAAEAWWIMSGSSLVSTIAPYNQNIAQFSDNGRSFFGAYGPKVVAQLGHVIETLDSDPESRQAGLTIWRESPAPSKDIPCTVAVWWNIRDGELCCTDFMRSSDQWLGLPYDVFNFSMLSAAICSALNRRRRERGDPLLALGALDLIAVSSHLYRSNADKALDIIESYDSDPVDDTGGPVPAILYDGTLTYGDLKAVLKAVADAEAANPIRWWLHPAEAWGNELVASLRGPEL